MSDINIRISESQTIFSGINRLLAHKSFYLDDRKIISVASFSASLEYHAALWLLCENNRVGAAANLLRSQVESYAKGVWVLYCGSDADVEAAHNDELSLGMKKLSLDLESKKVPGWEDVKEVKDSFWSILCGYTHTGKPQLARRFTGSNISPNYDEGFVKSVLNFGDLIAFKSLLELLKLSNSDDSEAELRSLIDSSKFLQQAFGP